MPLLPGGGLGVALFSYEGKLCWGFNGDYELVPDLAAFVDDVRVAFENLRNAAVARYMERRTASAELPDVLDLTQSALMSVEVQPGDEVEKQPAPVHAAGIG